MSTSLSVHDFRPSDKFEEQRLKSKSNKSLSGLNYESHSPEERGYSKAAVAPHRLQAANAPTVLIKDEATGIVIEEGWLQYNCYHRLGAPALIKRDASTGVVTYEAWFDDGKIHRIGSPAVIKRSPSGTVISEDWYRDGKRMD